ncbi:MAG: VOC family protein [Acidobacteria bacterium]|nr:VOC family protein [Acidobacteriota bacterium]
MTSLPFFTSGLQFDHIGMAVRSIRDAAGAAVEIIEDPVQRVSVAFVDMGGVRVELVEPLGAQSPVCQSLDKGQTLLHVCFRVADLEQAIAAGRRHGLHRLTAPVAAPAFAGRRIVWLFNKQFGLIELVEDAGEPQPQSDGSGYAAVPDAPTAPKARSHVPDRPQGGN